MKRKKLNPVSPIYTLLGTTLLMLSGSIAAQSVWVDPEAGAQLQASLEYLGDLDQFSVDTVNIFEEILEPGQKIQVDFAATLTVKRPDKLLVRRQGEQVDQTLYYDGKLLTLYDIANNVFAQTSAPETIEGMFDFARGSLGLSAPASDLLYRDIFPLMMEGVYSARVIGTTRIGSRKCVHLAFSRPDVDFQLWVSQDGKPLPCKYVVTDRNSYAQPSVTVVMDHWDTDLEINDSTFNFEPPRGSMSTDFMLLDANGNFVE